MSALVVTGTDTGVGKTLVAAALVAGLAARGLRIGVAKPVETGCAETPADAAALAGAAGAADALEVICPLRLPDPLAPLLAAERAGVAVDVPGLVARLRARAAAHDVLVVEGAGGLLVPLAPAVSYADLAAALAAPVMVVVGSRLGAINHALLTLEVLAARGLDVAGYVVSQLAPPGDLATDTNAALLARLTAVPCLGVLPWLADAPALVAALRGPEPAAARARLAELARAHLALDALA